MGQTAYSLTEPSGHATLRAREAARRTAERLRRTEIAQRDEQRVLTREMAGVVGAITGAVDSFALETKITTLMGLCEQGVRLAEVMAERESEEDRLDATQEARC